MYGAYEIEKVLLLGGGTKGIIGLRVDVGKLLVIHLRVDVGRAFPGDAKIVAAAATAREQHGYENEKPPRILQQVPSVVIEIADIRFDYRSDWRQGPLPETVPIEQRRSTARGDCVFLGWRGSGRGATRRRGDFRCRSWFPQQSSR